MDSHYHNKGPHQEQNDGLTVVYILAPLTVILTIAVIVYIAIRQRQLTRRMLESGKLFRNISLSTILKRLSVVIILCSCNASYAKTLDFTILNYFVCHTKFLKIAGQLVPVMPTVVTYQHQIAHQDLRSPTTGKLFVLHTRCNVYTNKIG